MTDHPNEVAENAVQDVQGLLNLDPLACTTTSRRRALRLTLGAGYAAAAMPIMAQTAIKTPHQGLQSEEVMIDAQGLRMPAYVSRPASGKSWPVVLVVSEIFGVHEYIADVTRRLAQQGYQAIAPDLFTRQGDPSAYGEIAKLQAEIISKVPDAQVMADLDACLAWAQKEGGDLRRLAITGFCWGGRITWLYAAHQARVRAAVAWYGRLKGAQTALTPEHPIHLAERLKAPVLGLYGGADTGIPMADVAQMQEALRTGSAAARDSRFEVYRQAPHAFHADYRASYREAEAKEAWSHLLDWFKQHGVV